MQVLSVGYRVYYNILLLVTNSFTVSISFPKQHMQLERMESNLQYGFACGQQIISQVFSCGIKPVAHYMIYTSDFLQTWETWERFLEISKVSDKWLHGLATKCYLCNESCIMVTQFLIYPKSTCDHRYIVQCMPRDHACTNRILGSSLGLRQTDKIMLYHIHVISNTCS